jgi:imidazolonepropionase-like amidohydrolase
MLEQNMAMIKMAHSRGLRIAVGTDAESNIGNSAFELELLVRAGLTPMEAIVAATANGAAALGLDGLIGTIEKGKLADILILAKNPLSDIKALQDGRTIVGILKSG